MLAWQCETLLCFQCIQYTVYRVDDTRALQSIERETKNRSEKNISTNSEIFFGNLKDYFVNIFMKYKNIFL